MKSIVIDLGHGGHDPGAKNGAISESYIVMSIGTKLEKKLSKTDIRYKFTRKNDSFVTLNDRCNIANRFNSDYFISIHCNSATNKNTRGVEVFQYDTKSNSLNEFSNNICFEISNLLGIPNRGLKTNTQFTVLKHTKMDAALIEIDFLSNNMFKDAIQSEKMQNDIVNIIYKQILSLIGYKDIYYRVCVGSYKHYDNAVVALENVKKVYKDAFILD